MLRWSVMVLLFVGLGNVAHAQFGIGGRYSVIQNGYWQEAFTTQGADYGDQLGGIYGLYWFRLKQKRVEFLPEIGYYHSLNKNVGTGPPNSLRGGYLQFNTDLYFLDFGSDCNCPTFSKQNDLLKRGLFVEITPGIEFRSLDIDYIEQNKLATKTFKNSVFRAYAGLGFDIGLSDLMTVTPTAGVTMIPGSAWDGVEDFLSIDTSGINRSGRNRDILWNVGLRLLLRPDYLRHRK